MALLMNCWKCKKQFTTSSHNSSHLCNDCNGVNEAKRLEKERWSKLTDSEKIEELLVRVTSLENHQCNPQY